MKFEKQIDCPDVKFDPYHHNEEYYDKCVETFRECKIIEKEQKR